MNKILYFFVLIFVTTQIYSQGENSLLWKIEGENLTQPSYLYGTIHFICPDDFKMEESIKEAFGKSKQVFLEIDFDDPGMMTEMQQILMMTNGKSAKDFLDEKDYNALNSYLKTELGMGLQMVGTIKPFALMSMMIIPMLGCQPKSFETEFVQMATSTEKEILGLETVSYQMGLFDSIPYENQYEMLVEMVNEKDSASAEFKLMVDAYKNKDLRKLGKMLNESDWDYKGYEDMLIYNRNKNWVPIIEKAAADKSTFIAVGAGHLPGEKGLIKLLRSKGYKVTPLL